MPVRHYRELIVWQKAMDLAAECYCQTGTFPKEERFGLTNQIRRAASSIPANIAEGQARSHTREFLQFLGIASGSLAEVETFLLLSLRIGYLTQEQIDPLLALSDEVSKMLTGLRKSLERREE